MEFHPEGFLVMFHQLATAWPLFVFFGGVFGPMVALVVIEPIVEKRKGGE